jgi:RHS repeat-associated protein
MVSATVDSAETTFAYRGDGLRESRTFNSNTVTFTWDIAAGLPVVIDDEDARYVYGAGLASQVTSSETYYYLADGLGSTMATVDSDGDVVNSYTYDVFGETRSESGAQANEFQFAGQQVDGSTGLQYLRARYLDMETGRFISREPMMAVLGWGGSPHAYAGANPISLIDPTGLRPAEVGECDSGPFAGSCPTTIGLQPDDLFDDSCADLYAVRPELCGFRKVTGYTVSPVEFHKDWASGLGIAGLGTCYEHLGSEYRTIVQVYQSEDDPSVTLTITSRQRRSVYKWGGGAGVGPVGYCPDWATDERRDPWTTVSSSPSISKTVK